MKSQGFVSWVAGPVSVVGRMREAISGIRPKSRMSLRSLISTRYFMRAAGIDWRIAARRGVNCHLQHRQDWQRQPVRLAVATLALSERQLAPASALLAEPDNVETPLPASRIARRWGLPPVNHVLATVTALLTIVPHNVTCGDSLLGRGTPFARALSEDGAGAVPAGGEYALRSRAVRASTPPAIGSAREVLRLSAGHDAGNACIR